MSDRKTAIVTGSTSGIGLAVARALAAAGHTIVMNGFGDPAEIERLRAGIEAETGSPVAFHDADMSNPAQIADLVRTAETLFGHIDIVVNNAGIQTVAPIEDFPVERYEMIMAVNMSAAWYLCRETFRGMKERGWGRVINVASAHALVASPYKSAYVMAKHAVLGLTRTLALEGAEHGVTVNAICPGYVLTPLVEKQIPETAKARGLTEDEVIRDVLLAAQPTRQFVKPEQIGALAAFLCTEAADQITGTALPVDGGWTAH
jgi:3-hydroxybutyrate dehydrogenase